MTKIYEADKLNAGEPQLILENKLISVMLQPEIGGRILDVETNDFPFLHRTYPKSVQFGSYTEYGGIEECIGSPLTEPALENTVENRERNRGGHTICYFTDAIR